MTALALLTQPTTIRSANEWALLIRDSIANAVDAIIRTGSLLKQAKETLPHGDFLDMIHRELPFSDRTAQRLMAIAADERITDATLHNRLPPSWGTLYELTRLDDATFSARLTDGTICADMQRGEAREGRLSARRTERIEEMRELSRNPLRLPQGPFMAGIIDPPWIDEDQPIGVTDRHYAMQYPLMTPTEIAAMPVGQIFGPVALIALWITDHHLIHASHLQVLAAWGFTPKTLIVWDKQWPGLGMGYVRNITEHVVIATRGSPPVPPAALRPPSLLSARRSTTHSAKPSIHDMIESWFGASDESAYVELFQRGDGREGWASFGNEARVEVRRERVRAALEFWD